MGRRKILALRFKHDNDTSALMIRLARALGLEGNLNWRSELARTLEVSQNNLSNWVMRDRPTMERVFRVIRDYNLPPDIIKMSRAPERAYVSEETLRKWPWLRRVIEKMNEAAENDDILELMSVFRYGIDNITHANLGQAQETQAQKTRKIKKKTQVTRKKKKK